MQPYSTEIQVQNMLQYFSTLNTQLINRHIDMNTDIHWNYKKQLNIEYHFKKSSDFYVDVRQPNDGVIIQPFVNKIVLAGERFEYEPCYDIDTIDSNIFPMLLLLGEHFIDKIKTCMILQYLNFNYFHLNNESVCITFKPRFNKDIWEPLLYEKDKK